MNGLKHLIKTASIENTLRYFEKKRNIKNKMQGREEIFRRYFNAHPIKKLHIGCGHQIIPGWLNTDLVWNSEIAFLDASEPFPFENNSFDYIFSEHIFEHLTLKQGRVMIQESYNKLKKNGVMRLAMPSMDFLFNLYAHPEAAMTQRYVQWAVENVPTLSEVAHVDKSQQHVYVVNNFFKDWDHQVIHSFESVKSLLTQAGFSEIKLCKVGESADPHLNNLEMHGHVIPPEMNEMETIVIEAKK